MSMERLTARDKNGLAMAACCEKECEYNYVCEFGGFGECRGMDDIIDRLAAYEDTGLEPSEVEQIQRAAEYMMFESVGDFVRYAIANFEELQQYHSIAPIDRLRELAQADKEGRCVVQRVGEKGG